MPSINYSTILALASPPKRRRPVVPPTHSPKRVSPSHSRRNKHPLSAASRKSRVPSEVTVILSLRRIRTLRLATRDPSSFLLRMTIRCHRTRNFRNAPLSRVPHPTGLGAKPPCRTWSHHHPAYMLSGQERLKWRSLP